MSDAPSSARTVLRRLGLGRVRALVQRVVIGLGYRAGPRLMSRLRKRWVVLRNPQADIRFTEPVYLGPGFSLHVPFGGQFIVGPGVEFRRGFRAELGGGEAKIVIGAGSYLTYDVIITCNTTIEIGQGCGIGQAVYVADGSHRFRDLDRPFLAQGYDYREIRIEDGVQIHSKCTIVNSIGTRSVIGANAVVSRPIPPYCLAAGVPARVIDYFGPPGGEPPEWEGSADDAPTASRSSRYGATTRPSAGADSDSSRRQASRK